MGYPEVCPGHSAVRGRSCLFSQFCPLPRVDCCLQLSGRAFGCLLPVLGQQLLAARVFRCLFFISGNHFGFEARFCLRSQRLPRGSFQAVPSAWSLKVCDDCPMHLGTVLSFRQRKPTELWPWRACRGHCVEGAAPYTVRSIYTAGQAALGQPLGTVRDPFLPSAAKGSLAGALSHRGPPLHQGGFSESAGLRCTGGKSQGRVKASSRRAGMGLAGAEISVGAALGGTLELPHHTAGTPTHWGLHPRTLRVHPLPCAQLHRVRSGVELLD